MAKRKAETEVVAADTPATERGETVAEESAQTPPKTGSSEDSLVTEAPDGFLVVTAAKPRRRAGRRFGPHETRIAVAGLTDAEIVAIRDDPVLRVRFIRDGIEY